ncbi:E domain-containing protein, partial [Mammaliicoccus sciuri]|uniref:E domain-containing protein n=1 Tax=Mammaliicoccus sciuri TaxID=1296 RepID=UPI0024372BD5
MKKKPKSRSTKIDFIPNRLNKYSIRKFTVGTASILVGATLLFGLGDEAKADELSSENSVQAQSKNSQSDEKSTEINVDKSSITPEEASTENETSEEVSSEEASTEEKVLEKATPEKASTEENTSEELSSKDKATEEISTEEPSTEVTATEDNTSTKGLTEKETENKAPENPNTEEVTPEESVPEKANSQDNASVEDVTKEQPIATEDVKVEKNSSLKVNKLNEQNVELAKNALSDEIKEAELKALVDSNNIDFSNLSNKEIKNELLHIALKEYSDKLNSEKLIATEAKNNYRSAFRSVAASRSLLSSENQSNALEVSDWNSFTNALNNTSVTNIKLTRDLVATKNETLKQNVGRALKINGDGHKIDMGNYFINSPANANSWDLSFNDINIDTNNPNGFIKFAPNNNNNHTLTFENVTHKGNNLIDSAETNNNVTVNIKGDFSTTSNDNSNARSNIGAKNINISENATVTAKRSGLGNIFEIGQGGTFTTGAAAKVNADTTSDNPWDVTNGHTIIKTNNNSTVSIGQGSKFDLKGQNIFSFGQNGNLLVGEEAIVNIKQKGNGNIVNMGIGSSFIIGQKAQFLAYSDEHRTPGANWSENNLIGLNGDSKIVLEKESKLFVDAKNHQWNTKSGSQSGAYNDLVNINAVGNQSALLHVKDNAILDLRTDNRDYYAEVISIPLGGNNQNRQYIFDNAYYVNLQKTSKVTSGESNNPPGSKPNLVFMDPGSPGFIKWKGSYIAKKWDPLHFSDPEQHEDADDVWRNVVDLSMEQNGFNSGVPVYNNAESTRLSERGTDLSKLNLNYAQRIVLISNKSNNPEASELIDDKEITKEPIPYETIREFDPNLPPGAADVIVQRGENGEKTTTIPTKVNPDTGEVVDRGEPSTEITKNPVNEIIHFAPEAVPPGHKDEFDPNLPVGETEEVPGKPGIKNPETGVIVTPPVDSVTKHGPVPGEPIVTKEPI